ncbi:RNase A-like domain-containing protein [Streptomyces sp. NPDC054961]
MRPHHLYAVSDAVAVEQASLHRVARELLDVLGGLAGAGGQGTAASALSDEYLRITSLFFDTHARTVTGIGGAAVGFTLTANTFGAADAASHPGSPPFAPRQPPWVIFLGPVYERVPRLGHGGGTGMNDILHELAGDFGDAAMAIMRPVIEKALPARALEVMPLPDYLRLDKVSWAWHQYVMPAGTVANQLTETVKQVTDSSPGANPDWHAAMLRFSSALWGTSAWGQQREGQRWGHDTPGNGMSRPVLGVLTNTAEQLAMALRLYAEAAKAVRDRLRELLYQAILDALKFIDLHDGPWDNVKRMGDRLWKIVGSASVAIVLNINVPEVNAAVDRYEEQLQQQRTAIGKLAPALEDAVRSVPTFMSEMARAEAFGTRALVEFNPDYMQQIRENAPPGARRYPILLASMEGANGAHTVDRHVGLSPDQLNQRLRDEPGLGSTSTYTSLSDAQRYTQAALDDVDKGRDIKRWLNNRRKDATYNPDATYGFNLTMSDVTGTVLTRGATASAQVKSVHLVLRYDPVTNMFVVVSSYPVPP